MNGQSGPGRRVEMGERSFSTLQPGEYGRCRDGKIYGVPPGAPGLIANLANHQITEHDDGTITVAPSILVEFPNMQPVSRWHGHLERGVWLAVE